MNPVGLIFVVAGLFSILGAAKNWDWFMDHRRARIWVKLFGREGARIFYYILGLFLLGIGGLMTIGVIAT